MRTRYVEAGGTVEDLAQEAGVCTQTIYRALARHKVPLRERDRTGVPYSLGEVLTEAFLRSRYQKQQQSVRQIATDVGCSESAVMARLRRYEIPRRGVQPVDRLILRDRLHKAALIQACSDGRSISEIAAEQSVDKGTVRAYLHRHRLG